MKRSWIVAILALGWLALATSAATAGEPAAPAKPEAEKPAAAEPLPSADVIEVLDKMDAAGKDLKTLRAKFDYECEQKLYEDVKKRKGDLLFSAPNLLRFEFTDKPPESFIFDGRVLHHKQDATKQLILWELRLPEEPPVDSLELGKTPFPLPFGQRKDAVLKHFTVTRGAKEEAADKEKRTVLVLVPRKDTELARDYAQVTLWIETKTWLPTQARLRDTNDNVVTTVVFHHIETNKDVDAKQFARPNVPQDWEIVAHPKEGGKSALPTEKP